MRVSRLLAVLAAAALAAGLISTSAIAGSKKKTQVVFFSGYPSVAKNGKVRAKGTLNTAAPCRRHRGVQIELLDVNGFAFGLLAGQTTDSNGNFNMSGDLPSPRPVGSVRVKVFKKKVDKLFCRASVSFAFPIP